MWTVKFIFKKRERQTPRFVTLDLKQRITISVKFAITISKYFLFVLACIGTISVFELQYRDCWF